MREGDSGGLGSGDLPGYTTTPPPGAGGPVAPAFQQPPAGRHVLATWLSRVGAALIDWVIIGVVALIPFLVLGAALGVGFAADSDATVWAALAGAILWVVCVTVIALVYAPVLMARTNGQTLGRMALGIRVVRTSREPVTFWFAFVREVLIKSLLFGLLGSITFGIASVLDVLWPLWDEENRALHDFMVGTRVVKDQPGPRGR